MKRISTRGRQQQLDEEEKERLQLSYEKLELEKELSRQFPSPTMHRQIYIVERLREIEKKLHPSI